MSELGRKVVLVDLDSGEQVFVSPISPLIVNNLISEMESRFPYPDEEPYRLPLPNAAIEGDTLPARDNPDYVKACREVDVERRKWQNQTICFMACKDAPIGKAALVAKYANDVEHLRSFSELPSDPWQATLTVLITTMQDFSFVINVATEGILITFQELRDGMRIFRLKVQGGATNGANGTERTPSIAEAESLHP